MCTKLLRGIIVALYDHNGRITIDENAAQYDVRKIQDAIQHLENSRKTMTSLIQQVSNMQGETGDAISEKAIELRKQIDSMIERLNESINFINKTVSHYQWLDKQVKDIINASGGDGSAVVGSTGLI